MNSYSGLEPWQQRESIYNLNTLPPPLNNYIIREVFLHRRARHAYIPPELTHPVETLYSSFRDSLPSSPFSSLSLHKRGYESGEESLNSQTTPESRMDIILEHQIRRAAPTPLLETDSGDTRASLYSPLSVLARTNSVSSSHITNITTRTTRTTRTIRTSRTSDRARTIRSGITQNSFYVEENERDRHRASELDSESSGVVQPDESGSSMIEMEQVNLSIWLAQTFCRSKEEFRDTIDTVLLQDKPMSRGLRWFLWNRDGWLRRCVRKMHGSRSEEDFEA